MSRSFAVSYEYEIHPFLNRPLLPPIELEVVNLCMGAIYYIQTSLRLLRGYLHH